MMQRLNQLYVSIICAIVICMFWPAKIDGHAPERIQNYTLMYKCDIVLILDDSVSIKHHPGGSENFDRMLHAVQKLPDHFVMGENYSRVAIIAVSHESRIMLNLTADASLVRSFWMNSSWGGTQTHLALQDAKDKVLVHSRPKAMKFVILITDGAAFAKDEAEKVAGELRNGGSLIYVAYIGSDYRDREDIKQHVDKVADNSSHVFPIDDFSSLTAAIFDMVIPVIKCEFQEGCRFSDSSRQTCVGEYWRMMVDDGNCTNALPSEPPNWKCVLSECNATCNEWPWEENQDRECRDEDAGKNLTVNRGPKPTEKSHRMFEHCLKQKAKTCPPLAVDPNVSTSEAAAVQWWVILVAVVSALVLLAAIIALVVVMTRKRRKKAEKAALMAKKRAAMEKVSSSDSPSTISGRSPMGKGRGPTQMTQFGYGQGQAAEHSVQVSLVATPSSSVRKSGAGKAVESSSTRKSGSGKAVESASTRKSGSGKAVESASTRKSGAGKAVESSSTRSAAKKSTSTNASNLKKAAPAGKKK